MPTILLLLAFIVEEMAEDDLVGVVMMGAGKCASLFFWFEINEDAD